MNVLFVIVHLIVKIKILKYFRVMEILHIPGQLQRVSTWKKITRFRVHIKYDNVLH